MLQNYKKKRLDELIFQNTDNGNLHLPLFFIGLQPKDV